MYLVTEMNWSDIAMGDGNPQTQVALRNTAEEAQRAVVDLVNKEYCPETEEGEERTIDSFDKAVEFLKEAPGSPEIDISEIQLGGEFQYLVRDVLDSEPRMFNGAREIGAPKSNGAVCAACRRRLRNDKAEKIVQLEKEIERLKDLAKRLGAQGE